MSLSNTSLDHLIGTERLPRTYLLEVNQWFIPLADKIADLCQKKHPLTVGIQGAQGTGKSTLAKVLSILLREQHHLNVARLSLDDFYLTRAERQHLAETVHPLLAVRGVPGTHDIDLAKDTLKKLHQQKTTCHVALPSFNKARDDRADRAFWSTVQTPLDAIILEGWCLCVPPQHEAALETPINALERDEDPDRQWRHYVNNCLKKNYPVIFNQVDFLVILKTPSFEAVYEWRLDQEEKLRARHKKTEHHLMTPSEIQRFIQFFERLTRHALTVLPQQANTVFNVNPDHTYTLSPSED